MSLHYDWGVVYVAMGIRARVAFNASYALLKCHSRDLPVTVLSDIQLTVRTILQEKRDPGARWQKLNLYELSPYYYTLYLDADTRPYVDVEPIFYPLIQGWDMVIVPSSQQGKDFLWKCSREEREQTKTQLANHDPLSLQGGVFAFKKTPPVKSFFDVWRAEWLQYRDQDQGALLRALHTVPLRVFLYGRPWNGGSAIGHSFGLARG